MYEALIVALFWVVPVLVFIGALIRPLGWPFHSYPMYSDYTPIADVRVYAVKFRRQGRSHFEFWEPHHFKEKMFSHGTLDRLIRTQAAPVDVLQTLMKMSMVAELNGEIDQLEALQLVERRFITRDSQLTPEDRILYEFEVGQ